MEKNWKSFFVDAVGVAAVVVSVLFVAYELHQANTLATTNVTYDLMQQHNELHFLVMSNPEVARLVGLAEVGATIDPSSTEYIQLRSLAWQQHNAWTQAHIAWREGQISRDDYQKMWVDDVAVTLTMWPGLRPHIAALLEGRPKSDLTPIEQAMFRASR